MKKIKSWLVKSNIDVINIFSFKFNELIKKMTSIDHLIENSSIILKNEQILIENSLIIIKMDKF